MSDPGDPVARVRLTPGERTWAGVYCPHCAALVSTDASSCPQCPPPDAVASTGACPTCKTPLVGEAIGAATAARCPACRGLWFDRGALLLALDLRTVAGSPAPTLAEVRKAIPPPPPDAGAGKRHLPCARCRDPMTRRTAAPLSNVLLSTCPRHGLWFCAGEYERFSAFVAAGGIELARRELQREAIDAAQARQSARRDEEIRTKRQLYRTGGFPYI